MGENGQDGDSFFTQIDSEVSRSVIDNNIIQLGPTVEEQTRNFITFPVRGIFKKFKGDNRKYFPLDGAPQTQIWKTTFFFY
jgi:hypothetical protein